MMHLKKDAFVKIIKTSKEMALDDEKKDYDKAQMKID